jgi:hypothetical protein
MTPPSKTPLVYTGRSEAPTVHTIAEAAAIARLSKRTFERLLYGGKGPEVIQLSPRRVGITDAAIRAWLTKRPLSAASIRKPENATA